MKYLFLSILSLFATSHIWAGDYQSLYQNLPVALVEPTAPVIPDTRVSIIDFGGVGDGITNNTEAFKKAISALSKKGGGHLDVPAGIYVVGLISLKDNIDLHLERNAMIMASPEKKDFLPADKDGAKAVPCISASKRHNISITGEGTIDGNGEWWRAVKRGKVSDEEWKAFQEMGGTVTADGKLWYPFDLKHFGNVADSYERQETMRTHLIRFTDCENVLVKGVTIQNAPKFHLVPQRCKHVIIDDVTVRCPWNAQNGDGIDLMQCQEVLVTRCKVDVGDDGICLKGGVGEEGVKYGPCQNILIVNNTVYHAHGGFVIGSEFSGGMFNIVVCDNTFSGTDKGLRFKSGPGRGGQTRNIYISRIYMSDIITEAVAFETSYTDKPVGSSGNTGNSVTVDFIPEFSDIHISNVICRDARTAIVARGNINMIHDISLVDCIFFYTTNEKAVDDPAMLQLSNVKFLTY